MCYNPVSQPQGVRIANELLTEAIAMYRQIGVPKHVEMAGALLGGSRVAHRRRRT